MTDDDIRAANSLLKNIDYHHREIRTLQAQIQGHLTQINKDRAKVESLKTGKTVEPATAEFQVVISEKPKNPGFVTNYGDPRAITPDPSRTVPLRGELHDNQGSHALTPNDVLCAECLRPRKQHNSGIDTGLGSCPAFKLPLPLLSRNDVQWVVNDIAELGVKIGDQFFWLYKGRSLVYRHEHDKGEPMLWRPVGKREFGETVKPVQEIYENDAAWSKDRDRYILPLVDDNGPLLNGGWQPLLPQPHADKDD